MKKVVVTTLIGLWIASIVVTRLTGLRILSLVIIGAGLLAGVMICLAKLDDDDDPLAAALISTGI